jgi:hypothetical protein
MGQKLSNIHCLVDKTMNICESYLTKTYLKISRASSCRCIGIAECLRYNQGSFTRFLGKTLDIWYSQVWGEGIRVNVQDWSLHMNFILKGSQIAALQGKGCFKLKTSIQEYRIGIQNSYQTCAWIIWYMFPGIMWEIKNQPSNSTSCSDNALRLLVLVAGRLYWGLQVTSPFSIWGCVVKGCFERGMLSFEGPNHVWRALKTSIFRILFWIECSSLLQGTITQPAQVQPCRWTPQDWVTDYDP